MYFKKRADNTNNITLPHVLTPSGDFDGNDGKWSTFTINIGDSNGEGTGQNFKVLISTSSSLTLVPQQADWCDADCAEQRGIEPFNADHPLGFESSSSGSWNPKGIYSIPVPDWWTGTKPNGTFGFDAVGLGPSDKSTSLVVPTQWVVEYRAKELFMGSFGLAVGPVSIGGSAQKNPFLRDFVDSNSIPSLSYGYTAGASYQNSSKGTLGSLILGGFDQSRLKQQGIMVPMASAADNDLVVGVQSILYHPDPSADTNDYSITNSSTRFLATIDSTLPYLYLPDAICDQFADKFRLEFDNSTGLYTVNDTSHQYNLKQKASVTFSIVAGLDLNLDSTSITLPYAAFDLQASSPIYAKPTNYFPIKKSESGKFVLGRTFLQEAYVIVDYERKNFTVAPAAYSDPMPASRIVSIFPTDYIQPGATNTPGSTTSKKGLAPGAVAGIVVAIVVVFLLLGLGAFFFWKKRRAPKKDEKGEVSEIDTTAAGTEVKHQRMSELDSDPQGKPLGGFYSGSRDNKDLAPFPPISEMESPPAELSSLPPESARMSPSTPGADRGMAGDYFTKPRRRGATRESSQSNTPGPTIHELPGDDGQFQVNGLHFDRIASPPPERPVHSRGPSDSSLGTNIDEVIAGSRAGADRSISRPAAERRPSHARGASDTTVDSDTTAVSQPTPEEIENWARGVGSEPRRPLSG